GDAFENESRALGDVNISDFHFFFKSRMFQAMRGISLSHPFFESHQTKRDTF
ncbi:MAG: hypothetical protein ACI8RD_007980, partial [Bacillariaceae sp.]